MTLAKRILSRPMTMLVIFGVLTIAGLALTLKLPLQLLPDMEMPVLAVHTIYPMASPSEVEENVTKIIEEQLTNVSGLDRLESYSMEATSLIILSYDYDVDLAAAKDDVRDKLAQAAYNLNDDVWNPTIYEFDPNQMPIMILSYTGDQGLQELLKISEDEIKPRLERINGVAQVNLWGGLEEIVRVDIYQEQLDSQGLTISSISAMLGAQNMKLGAGAITDGNIEYSIETKGDFQSLEDLERTVVGMVPLEGGRMHQILLRDVADVSFGTRDEETKVLVDGVPGIRIEIQKADGANIVEVASEILALVPQFNSEVPKGSRVEVLSDDSVKVKDTFWQVVSSAIYGIIFAVLVLFFFLRQIRPTLIVVISIPVSLLITIGAMSFAGKSFNMITMTGMVLALGMIVDGSIVIIENIYRYRTKGVLMKSAAELGTQEMIGSITGSILTSICVFLPMLLFKAELELIGVMFEDMAFTIIVALLSSLFIALILVPVLAYKVLPFTTREESPLKNDFLRRLDQGIQNGLDTMKRGYKRGVGWCLHHRKSMIGLTLILFFTSGYALSVVGLIIMPGSGETSIILEVKMPVGTSVNVTEEVMLQWQTIADREIKDKNHLIVSAGAMSSVGTVKSYVGQMEITLPPISEREASDDEIKDTLRQFFDMFPDAEITFTTTDQARQMTGSDISFQIEGKDMDELIKTSEAIIDLLEEEVPLIQEVSTTQANSLPQLNLELNRQKIFDLGLNTASIASEIRSQIAGTDATTFDLNGESLDVVLQLREEDRNSAFDIDKIFVTSAITGEKIPFSSFGRVVKSTSPVTITRIDRTRTITIEGEAVPNAKISKLQKDVENLINEKIIFPDGVAVSNAGQFSMMGDILSGVLLVLFFAALLVMGVMVSQFESFKSPFIIMLMMPGLLIGVAFVYLIMGEPLSMPSLLGIVMLLGIVVNNGIIMVDAINLRRKRGETIMDACQNAAAGRLQPVLMTTLTTILAMAPMSIFGGEGTDMVKPMGLTVIGGLTSNTLVTLFLVPVLYVIFHKREYKREVLAEEQVALYGNFNRGEM